MKHLILFIALLLSTTPCWTQSEKKAPTPAQSKAEEFSEQAGSLIERQFVDVGQVKGLKVRMAKFTDMIKGSSFNALRFEFDYKSTYASSSDTKIASLDPDEIDGLVKSLRALQTTVFPSTRESYTEVTFRSRTGFQAGAFFDTKKKSWTPYVQVEKFDNNSLVFLSLEDFPKLIELVEGAQAMMK